VSSKPTEAEKVERAVVAMTAPQALRFLAELVRMGGSRARCEAIAALMVTVAGTMDTQQAIVRGGIPVDSLEDALLSFREYAVRSVEPAGGERFVTYGDRLFTAVRDAAALGEAEVLCRDVAVGPWVPNVTVRDGGAVRRDGV
jgi:hypothetical protein